MSVKAGDDDEGRASFLFWAPQPKEDHLPINNPGCFLALERHAELLELDSVVAITSVPEAGNIPTLQGSAQHCLAKPIEF